MKRKWILKVYKIDRRAKEGRKHLQNIETPEMTVEEAEIYSVNITRFAGDVLAIDIVPATRIVKSLMTGQEVEIAFDTPHCCDPSTETYWSM